MNLEKENILQIAVEKSQDYLNRIAANYVYSHHKYEEHTKIRFYKTYEHYFNFEEKNIQIDIDITKYEDNKMILFFNIKKSNEKGKYFHLSEYFRQYKKVDYREKFVLSNYEGATLSEKLDHFFAWLLSVTDEKLIKIFKGEDWVDISFDWGDLK